MTTRKEFLAGCGSAMAALAMGSTPLAATAKAAKGKYTTNRPPLAERNFTSRAVEATIAKVKAEIKDPKLAWMFENCYPNTLDTTVTYSVGADGRPNTFVITGDIDAMWLRDSAAQVWPYVILCNDDTDLKNLVAGTINQQMKLIQHDPYANAFLNDDTKHAWKDDLTEMKPFIHERKWEIDSLCYPVRLAYHYWKTTGDTTVFEKDWKAATQLILKTFKEQQRKDGTTPYVFMRKTQKATDTMINEGFGSPVKPCGLIYSAFRPSDDATVYGYLIPSNLFAVNSLRKMAEISQKVTGDTKTAKAAAALADEVEAAVNKFGVGTHPVSGKIYAFESDGFGNALFMDDANIPSLLALPYLGAVEVNDPLYQATRKFVWSENNPYFFKGKAMEGIGGPHVGYDMVWPMSIIMRALTSTSDQEIVWCLRTLRDTDADTGFMHESVHKDDPKHYTRYWFAWVNTLFGELIVKLHSEGKMNLVNSI